MTAAEWIFTVGISILASLMLMLIGLVFLTYQRKRARGESFRHWFHAFLDNEQSQK